MQSEGLVHPSTGLQLACDARQDADGCETNGGVADEGEIPAQFLLVAQLPDAYFTRIHGWILSQLHAYGCPCICTIKMHGEQIAHSHKQCKGLPASCVSAGDTSGVGHAAGTVLKQWMAL